MNAYAPAINLAGRQRMLSQKLTKSALKWQAAENDQLRARCGEELRGTLEQWVAAHLALQNGDHKLGIEKLKASNKMDGDCPNFAQSAEQNGTVPFSPAILLDALHVPGVNRAWNTLQPHFEAMSAAASAILKPAPLEPSNADSSANLNAASTRAIASIVENEADYLTTMDSIVKILEEEAGHQIVLLRMFGVCIASGVIALLVGLGWFVVRPATGAIRGQVDELELRVDERTRELAEANQSLEQEMLERSKADARMQLLANQLAHAARVSTMGHLTAGLAHELNQPLAAIVNYAETCDLLLSPEHRDERGNLARHIVQIKQASTRAGQIVRRMRDFVRPNSAAMLEVDLNELVHEVAELCRSEANRAEVQLLLDLSASQPRACVDPIQIQQVLVNLVQNALQAMQNASSGERLLVIRITAGNELARIEVTDSGPGLDTVDDMAIFTPFYTTKPDGLGIGLAICRSIVERHQGRIYAQNAPRGGATIGFTLPLVLPTGAELNESNKTINLLVIPCEVC
jgi:C4-dicarboxylate-specific signal transduction histidine kinase